MPAQTRNATKSQCFDSDLPEPVSISTRLDDTSPPKRPHASPLRTQDDTPNLLRIDHHTETEQRARLGTIKTERK